MEIKDLTSNKFSAWDEFCVLSDDAWFWHTSGWLAYHLSYRPELRPQTKSFFVEIDGRIAAICPLLLEDYQGKKEFSFGGEYGPVPAFHNDLGKMVKEKLKKVVFEEIDRRANAYAVKRVCFRFTILSHVFSEREERWFNYLLKFGYLDNSLNTQIIDLGKPAVELRREIRHGHDAAIARAEKGLSSEIFEQTNITAEVFEQYVSLHQKAAGRVTRPSQTFDLMLEFIKQDKAFLVGALQNRKFLGFAYFFLYKNKVYYGSSCNDPEAADLPVGHFIQWQAIEYMQRRHCQFYEIGLQQYGPTFSDFPTSKAIQVGAFKRGFGGFTAPCFRAEKFYDKGYFLEVYQDRLKKFANTL